MLNRHPQGRIDPPRPKWPLGAVRAQVARLALPLSETAFEQLLCKEIARCERRITQREFALIDLGLPVSPALSNRFLAFVRERLRITDEIGVRAGRLHLLLPETGVHGAQCVSVEIEEIGRQELIQVKTVIKIFPWDDQIVSKSQELNELAFPSDGDRHLAGDRISAGPRGTIESEQEIARRVFQAGDQSILRSLPTPIWKRLMDFCGAGLGLVLLSPLLALTALVIRLDSPGPIFFVQRREGLDGRIFKIIKFRTMQADAELQQFKLWPASEQDGPAFKLEADPRVTRVGRFLRLSCIDELPQLINVLRCEMSLVGPRPLPVAESEASRGWQRRRLCALPGLTCIWQVEGGRNVSFDDWMRMDIDYLRRRSFWFDLRLIAQTLRLALTLRGSV